MRDNLKAMVLASFVADSLAMPAHWIYDTNEIEKIFGRVKHLLQPLDKSYHAAKQLGEATHYGDQMMVLLESVAETSGFDLEHFGQSWRKMFKGYGGYFDNATKTTLKNFADGKDVKEAGSSSSDLAGAARISPIVYYYPNDLGKLVFNCRAQTAMTHKNAVVIDAAEFFAKAAHKIINGSSPLSAFESLTREPPANSEPFKKWIEEALKITGEETRDVIGTFGRSCSVQGAFRSVVHIIARYQDNLREALIENVMAGGDSAARGMLIGMVLGAYNGMKAVPGEWVSKLKNNQHITELLSKIDSSRSLD